MTVEVVIFSLGIVVVLLVLSVRWLRISYQAAAGRKVVRSLAYDYQDLNDPAAAKIV
jgi:hypothetical protein